MDGRDLRQRRLLARTVQSRRLLVVLAVALLLATLATSVLADSRDGPIFEDTATNGRQDVGDLYVFRSPSNANNTVLIATISPFAGNVTPVTFDETLSLDIKIDTSSTLDAIEDLTFRVNFGPPDASNLQDVVLRGLPSARFGSRTTLARGRTDRLPATIAGGGTFAAGVFDNPVFFDQGAFATLLNGGPFPRSSGAHNFFGPNGNVLAVVIEVPSTLLGGNSSIIGVWARSDRDGTQFDREGRPMVNLGLIPPLPRGSLFPIGGGGGVQNRQERRNAFNAGLPRNDHTNFKADMVSVLTNFWGRGAGDASVFPDAFLPDVLAFQVGNPNGFGTIIGPGANVFGNGRRLSDDVYDTMLNTISNGAIPTDNVPDDNGLRVTDGSVDPVSAQTRAIAFPYIGAPNLPLNGAGTGPNP